MRYIINGKVIFDPVKHTLQAYPLSSESEIKLNQPASRCFLLLIKNNDEVMKQDFFIEEVWRKKGMEVTINTFYQNISLLRKALKEIGLTESVVITVPKEGLTFSGSTVVHNEDEDVNECDLECEPGCDLEYDLEEQGVDKTPQQNVYNKTSQQSSSPSPEATNSNIAKKTWRVINMILLAILSLYIIKEQYTLHYNKKKPSNYTSIIIHDECKAYTSSTSNIKKNEWIERKETIYEYKKCDLDHTTFYFYSINSFVPCTKSNYLLYQPPYILASLI